MIADRIALPCVLLAAAAVGIVATPSQPSPPQTRGSFDYDDDPPRVQTVLPVEVIPTGTDAVEKAARDNQFLITRCWNLSLEKQPKLHVARSHATITFDHDGKVSTVALDGIPPDDGDLRACLDRVIRRDWRIDGKWAGTYKITLAFQ